jgi:formamidopyrimidine-DNA glycosylase
MPELPDVEIMRQYLDATSLHHTIAQVHIHNDKVVRGVNGSTLRRHLKGKEFKNTRRHGKNLFVTLDHDSTVLLLHFGMSGRLELHRKPGKTPQHSRVSFEFADQSSLHFVCTRMFGTVRMIDSIADYLREHNIGHDIMDISLEDFISIITHHRCAIKAFLMNQQYVAGLGTIYADEVLYQSAIHPQKSANELTRDQMTTIYKNVHRVIGKAVEKNANPDNMPAGFLLPQRKKGGRCPRCGRQLTSINIRSRTTWMCSHCQKK